MSAGNIIGEIVRLFLLLTPFFVLSVFIAMCENMEKKARRSLAVRTSVAVGLTCLILFLFGNLIFRYLGITLDAFRVGCGLVLMLSGIDLVRDSGTPKAREIESGDDPAVVPLAIPCTVGPGTIGALLVGGAATSGVQAYVAGVISIVIAVFLLGCVLYHSDVLTRVLKHRGVKILSKLTGMYLVALAAQIIGTGIKGFLQ